MWAIRKESGCVCLGNRLRDSPGTAPLLRNEKDIGKVYNEDLHIETKAAVTRERRERLRKNWGFDRVLKGRGFSRWGKLRVSERLFSQPLESRRSASWRPVVEMVIS